MGLFLDVYPICMSFSFTEFMDLVFTEYYSHLVIAAVCHSVMYPAVHNQTIIDFANTLFQHYVWELHPV